MNKVRFNKVRLSLAVLLCLCATSMVDAKVKLPALISDGMVLQREQPIKVWGTADAGESVQVKFLKNATPTGVKGGKLKVAYTVTADANGRWTLTLPAMKPGGPYILQVNDIELKDILVGDVWLCSGQSNMELPVSRVTDMFRDEIAAYENTNIRQLKVPNIFNFHAPQADLPDYVAWKPLTQENVMNFSALGYFFAKAMYEKNSIPVGLINSSWGGTPVEAWISEEGLKEFPKYINDKRQYEDDAYLKSIKQTEGLSFYRWNTSLYQGDAGLHEATPWYAANYNDKDWKTVDLFSTDWGTNGLNPINGSHWFRKEVEVPQDWNGKEATLRLGCIVDADSVYVNGTFVGTISYQYPPRIYTIPAGVLKAGKNTVTIRLISNNSYPHFVKEKPYKIICGNEEVSLQGEWKYRLGAPMPPAPGMMFFCYEPVCLYNAMIAPLQNYGIRGVLWYQGESNVDRRNEYAALLTALIADWRNTFGNPELPFYIVELADFLSRDDVSGRQAWAEMRKEQAKVAETNRNTRLIRNSDLGEWNDIHPLDKKTLGQRAAESALENNK
ncbi:MULTISPECIES: sialate O-acetylesterase [Bacteroides]|jgi:sialate O-acetylesterase|uniref:Sialate O-acetylesterase n=2 Tax=Bacteroides intestinalis TaxID=329854 RepID=A0A3E4KZT2_9BACE|nr:sialate O-acetylesterase [Bacteroides intestinalis]EDV05057.1 glycosyl hydrolase family 2, sugar binding domain protein [Bacteroides intestinalis DSM 17393]RGK26482.1 sialate O-acetylesterase [Bacteroides intestinalis]RGT51272.1 sialate O-acetylesterase [Bacteroides intestinalis]RHE84739.1 sialate O-acetylesterase [Bacteroides intestinalis]RHN08236.1 sialate O-acetylesterase [Bacteroides intestinalis]